MALELLDGTVATIDFSIAYSGTAQTSLKCAFNYLSARMQRGFTEQTTFCSSGWVQENPGMKQVLLHLDGFVSKGAVFSDPLALFADNIAKPFIFTATTGCTLSGSAHASLDAMGMRAAANSERGIDLRSYGPVTSVWVVA